MRRLPTCLVLACGLGCLLTPAAGPGAERKCSVSVAHSGDDTIGQRLASALKERIAASSHYRLVEEESAVVSIRMVSVDAEKSDQGRASAVALEFAYFTPDDRSCRATQLAVLQLGAKEIADHAERILSSLDRHSSEFNFACEH
jgi:hypothetical protein